jgi:hypothetical protein
VVDTPPMSVSWPLAVTCTPTQQRCLASDYGLNGLPRVLGDT